MIAVAFLRRWAHCFWGIYRYVFGRTPIVHQGLTEYHTFGGKLLVDFVGCTCGKAFHLRPGYPTRRFYVAVKTRFDDPIHDHRRVHFILYYDGWQLATSSDVNVVASFDSADEAMGPLLDVVEEHRPRSALILSQWPGLEPLDGNCVFFHGEP